MPWFINHYECDKCGCQWEDAWSAMCDDQCPNCGAKDMSPSDSIDKTLYINETDSEFQVYKMPHDATSDADYELIAEFDTREEAEDCMAFEAVEFDPDGPIGFGV